MQLWFNKIIITVFLACIGLNVFSQEDLLSDIQIIKQNRIEKSIEQKNTRPFIYSEDTPALKKYNPVNLVFGGLLFFYQNALSQQFSANCLYNPSCSEFSKQSIKEYGLLKGIFLSADRVMRCNRIAATGIHPLRIENNKVQDPVLFYRIKE
ncbi:MAG: membrane protein insertion efficiency factor YidD [Prolixibacteraceae bacterium]|nr:membrane protein insertion efficiency factor YidD [Prolixibacteraceae bacterium]